MSLGLIADDQGRRHHLPAPIHHLIRTLTEKQNKKETTISWCTGEYDVLCCENCLVIKRKCFIDCGVNIG